MTPMLDEDTPHYLGPAVVLPMLESLDGHRGLYKAVKALYEERDELRKRLESSNAVIEFLLEGGDPALVKKTKS